MKRHDERENNDGNIRKEASKDPDIHIQQPLGLDSSTYRRLGRLRSTPIEVLKADE
jgi:hypothetical protein